MAQVMSDTAMTGHHPAARPPYPPHAPHGGTAAGSAVPPPVAPATSRPPGTGRLRNGNPPGDLRRARRCGARARTGHACRQPAMRNGRCRLHGGASTGPRTLEGLARSRRARWIDGRRSREFAELRREGRRIRRRIEALCLEARARLALDAGKPVARAWLARRARSAPSPAGRSPVDMGSIVGFSIGPLPNAPASPLAAPLADAASPRDRPPAAASPPAARAKSALERDCNSGKVTGNQNQPAGGRVGRLGITRTRR